ncbi:hypothetical protein [Clostridium perfringens]|uniref:hypothetical protein n=1 Tax=Clostridium perfringens TaxID=1502 RepID=UPI00321BECEC
MKVNLLDMYTPHELGIMTYKDIAAKKEKKDKEVYAYLKCRDIRCRKKMECKSWRI